MPLRSAALAILHLTIVEDPFYGARPQLLAILACPKCKGTLDYREQDSALDCAACKLRYAVRDDIPVMLIDEATPIA